MSENLENQVNVENSKVSADNTTENVELVSQETFENADKSAPSAIKARKPLSKKAKIGIIAGAAAAVIVLTIVIVVLVLVLSSKPSGAIDDFDVSKQTSAINIAAGADAKLDLNKVFPGKTGFSTDSTKATIADGVMTVVAASGSSFDLTFSGTVDGKVKNETVTVKVNSGKNVDTIEEFNAAITAKDKFINITADLASLPFAKAADQKGYTVESVTVSGNGFEFDATSISARTYTKSGKVDFGGDTVFSVSSKGDGVVFQDLHVIGEKIKRVEGVAISLDEFESNGALFSAYGADGNRANLTLDNCITENGQKHLFINSADVLIKNTLLRNGADAIIAVETNEKSGAILTVEDTIISNSVVAGILFCGWTNVNADPKTTCKLIVKGFLDIYNWKDTTTTKLVPSSEGWMANTVNNMVGSQIKQLTKDKKAVKEYMAKVDGQLYVHIGIIILATGSFKANVTITEGMNEIGYVKRKFPIPGFASAIAKTCELLGYNQETTKNTKVLPKKNYGGTEHANQLGIIVTK